MSKRSQVIDKYWLEYITWLKANLAYPTIDTAKNLTEARFWDWFYKEKVQPNPSNLDEYLKAQS